MARPIKDFAVRITASAFLLLDVAAYAGVVNVNNISTARPTAMIFFVIITLLTLSIIKMKALYASLYLIG